MNTNSPNSTHPVPNRQLVNDHPLVLIAFFRRWKQSFIRDLIYTFILGLGFCVFFFGLYAFNSPPGKLAERWWNDFIVGMAISYSIHFLFELSDVVLARWLRKAQAWFRSAYYVTVSIIGVYIGIFIASILLDPTAASRHFFSPPLMLSFTIISVLVSCVLLFVNLLQERELRDKEHLAFEQRRASESERRALEARLRMLQAQIEPHFLYNTLANVVGLIQPAPERARLLLERLIDYLRATLAASRNTDATMQSEIDTITAYLELMKLRMGERLRYRIELAQATHTLPIPPMLLQPVVENAISHGLEPKIEGGEIVLTANIVANYLSILISDTGVGFHTFASNKAGGGVGLSNLRERIAALYGNEGSISIADNAAGGVSVTLRIPLLASAADKDAA